MTAPVPKPGILDIAAYVPGDGDGAGGNAVTKLSANENPYGPSPAAVAAYRAGAERLHIYPAGGHESLRETIAEIHGLEANRIVCGAGSDELISLLCNAYAGPGRTVLHTVHGFAMYPISARAAGATPQAVAEVARVADPDAILAAVTDETAMVFLANPNNPTGTMLSADAVVRLADGLPGDVMLVLDGAYAEYVPEYDGGAGLVRDRQNVVMTRTFSKIHGLGGLRVGWAYAPPAIVDVLNRIRGPFNVSAPALAAAEAALRDRAYVERCRMLNAQWRDWMVSALSHMGLPTDASAANFVLPRFASAEAAAAADLRLRQHGLIARPVGGYGLPEHLRITVGDEIACRRVVSILGDFLAEAA